MIGDPTPVDCVPGYATIRQVERMKRTSGTDDQNDLARGGHALRQHLATADVERVHRALGVRRASLQPACIVRPIKNTQKFEKKSIFSLIGEAV